MSVTFWTDRNNATTPTGMHIGIFGGSFNPVHNGHIAIARKVVDSGEVDEVWLMVSPLNPFKQHDRLLDDDLRLAMTRLAVEQEQGIVCSDYEFRLPRPSYTWHTLQSLVKDYPNDTFSLIIGADNWCSFSAWRNHDEIIAGHRIYVYPRTGFPIGRRTLPPGVSVIDMDTIDVSSTEIRRLLHVGEDISDLVPQCIADMAARFLSD